MTHHTSFLPDLFLEKGIKVNKCKTGKKTNPTIEETKALYENLIGIDIPELNNKNIKEIKGIENWTPVTYKWEGYFFYGIFDNKTNAIRVSKSSKDKMEFIKI